MNAQQVFLLHTESIPHTIRQRLLQESSFRAYRMDTAPERKLRRKQKMAVIRGGMRNDHEASEEAPTRTSSVNTYDLSDESILRKPEGGIVPKPPSLYESKRIKWELYGRGGVRIPGTRVGSAASSAGSESSPQQMEDSVPALLSTGDLGQFSDLPTPRVPSFRDHPPSIRGSHPFRGQYQLH